jgi:hypothetical protein
VTTGDTIDNDSCKISVNARKMSMKVAIQETRRKHFKVTGVRLCIEKYGEVFVTDRRMLIFVAD